MKKAALFSGCLFICLFARSQEDTLAEKSLDEAIIYSNKFAEKKKNLAQKIDLIGSRVIARYNSQNTGDLLINTGNVFVQKSQQGGSSPVLRGFEASRILIVIDGVRMNNAVYRAGHLQNVITVDQNMLERVEVLYGPASTIYGSDALGGVIHFRTKSPRLSGDSNFLAGGSGLVRYSSANKEKTAHADISLGWKKFGWIQSFTYSDFDDLRMGSHYPEKYPDFGRRTMFIETINGSDVIRINEDDRIQRFSGYRQWDILQKFLFNPDEHSSHAFNFQYSNSGDVPRYDRLQDTKNFGGSVGTTLRWAEWYYGPQTRIMGTYEYNREMTGFLDNIRFNINYQDIKESRQQREYLRYDRFDSRREHVRVWGFNLDGRKIWGDHELNMGLDAQLNDVDSKADRTNLQTGVKSPLDTRYPNGENRMNYFGFYLQHLKKIKSGKWVLNDGIRFQATLLHSTIADNSFFNLPVTDFRQSPFAVTGNIGIVYMPAAGTRFHGNLSSGFRAPNIDDVSRIFESSSAQKRVIIPNPELDPEYTYNLDLGVTRDFENKVRFELSAFYTLFRDAIALAPFQLNGQDSFDYYGVISAVYANRNVNKAYVTGFNTRLRLNFSENVVFDNTFTYTHGRYIYDDDTKKPMDHIPPVFGKSSLAYNQGGLGVETYMIYNGWKRIRDFNTDGEDNGQYATPDGMPCWLTLNARGNYNIGRHFSVQAGIENILDRNYRYFASGFSAPGRNLILSLRASF